MSTTARVTRRPSRAVSTLATLLAGATGFAAALAVCAALTADSLAPPMTPTTAPFITAEPTVEPTLVEPFDAATVTVLEPPEWPRPAPEAVPAPVALLPESPTVALPAHPAFRPTSSIDLLPPVRPTRPPLFRVLFDPSRVAPPQLTAKQLLAQMAATPEVRLPAPEDDLLSTPFAHHPELNGLPFLRGDACQLPPGTAREFGQRAQSVRNFCAGASNTLANDQPWHHKSTLARLAANAKEADLPLLLQMLQCESGPLRELLIEYARRAAGPVSRKVLAHRALYEPDPDLRERAVRALRERPPAAARQPLLDGFRHPWPPVADHAAAALIALGDREAVPALVNLLDAPDPARPSPDPERTPVVREVVRINHARNCQLCHATSWVSTDPARVAVPSPDAPLPPPFSVAYYTPQSSEPFVRADFTYLRQDFSLTLPVADPGPWPTEQRFDFFVRTRPAEAWEVAQPGEDGQFPQRRAVLRALRAITGRDFGIWPEDWREGLRRAGYQV